MERKELFDRTIGYLVKAYFEGHLNWMEPCGCAIGNLIAANNGYKVTKPLDEEDTLVWDLGVVEQSWSYVHLSGCGKPYNKNLESYKIGKIQLESTGYSIKETCNIEASFMWCYGVNSPDNLYADNFTRLMAVVDCLMEIHEASVEEVKEAKELFVKVQINKPINKITVTI